MIFQDLHMHTFYDDGKDSPEDMIISGINLNLSSIGITAHSSIPGEDWCVPVDKIPSFQEDVITSGEKHKQSITTYCGLEYDILSEPYFDGFDYVIGSVHSLVVDGKKWDIDNTAELAVEMVKSAFCNDFEAAAAEYYSQVSKLADINEVDIIGHFDLLTKYDENFHIYKESEKYLQQAYKTIDKLIDSDKIFEINTGAISRGYRTSPYPSIELLSYISSKKGKICLSSDAHTKENIAYKFDLALRTAYDCGFRSIWQYDDGSFKQFKINN